MVDPPQGIECADGGLFQDTEPIDEEIYPLGANDSSLLPIELGKLLFDTQVVEDPDCVGMQVVNGDDKEVVVDSEEDIGDCANVVGFLRRQPGLHSRQVGDLAGDSVVSGEGQCGSVTGSASTSKYIGLEEPEDLSQENALDFVDKFLSSKKVDYSPVTEPRNAARKFSPILTANGPQTLAKFIKSRTKETRSGIFKWNNGEQHEEADFFGRRINATCDSRGCLHEHERSHQKDSKTERAAYNGKGTWSKENCANIHQEVTVERPDKQLSSVALDHESGECIVESITSEMYDVGFSTQMAAEAIADLLHGDPEQFSLADACQGPQNSLQESPRDRGKKQVDSRKSFVQECSFTEIEGIARASKRKRSKSRRGPSNFVWRHNSSRNGAELPENARPNQSEPLTKDLNGSESTSPDENLKRKLPKLSQETKEPAGEYDFQLSSLTPNISLGKQQVRLIPVANDFVHEITNDKLTNTKHESDKPEKGRNEVTKSPLITYIYRRKKRQGNPQVQVNAHVHGQGITESKSTWTIDGSGGHEERINKAIESPLITYRRKRSSLGLKPSEVLNSGVKASGHSSIESMDNVQVQERKINLGVTCSFELDAWSCPKGKRTRRLLPSLTQTRNKSVKLIAAEGVECHKRQSNKILPKSSLLKELISLRVPLSSPNCTWRDLRQRRDMTFFCVLFSQHLDDNIIKQQKKICSRMGVSVTTCLMDATHFIADQFVRTRNMLEAIALGKPVVTHLWLESCGQASCLIDEKNYILRDAKKEKEIGFSLPVSLSRARQHPLLKGWRVLLTPNVKPGQEMISTLVKAAHGEIVKQNQITTQRISEDLLILSCKEDYAVCLPLIGKGAAVYSSELLLNGIIVQKLEYKRYQIFKKYAKK